jgi:hypothetical protein
MARLQARQSNRVDDAGRRRVHPALAACANAQFKGVEPDLGYGLRHAGARLAPILVWALLSTSVGLILKAVANWFSKWAI